MWPALAGLPGPQDPSAPAHTMSANILGGSEKGTGQQTKGERVILKAKGPRSSSPQEEQSEGS